MSAVSPKFELEDLLSVLESSAEKAEKKEKALDATGRLGFARSIVTFVRRSTPLSTAQKNALAQQRHYLVEEAVVAPHQLFANPNAPLTVEIGFGMGTTLVEMAKNMPERNFLGIEVHIPGIGQCLHEAAQHQLTNLRVVNRDAIEVLMEMPDASIDTIQLYFPDPWQKRKHYKRRFVLPERMQLIAQKLKQGGVFHAATDWEHYAHWMLAVLEREPMLANATGKPEFAPRPDYRPLTKFEKRGLDAGHGVWDVLYIKK